MTAVRSRPMLLVIDAGNTNVTLGVFRERQLVAQWRLVTDREKSSDGLEHEVRSLFERSGIDRKEIEAIAVSSVVPPLDHAFKQMAAVYFNLTPFFIDHTTDTGLKILYDSPSDVGADRIVDAVAAVAK